MAIAPGTRFGPYEIQTAVGAGGMGEVYCARDSRLGRKVAIKFVPSHLASDPDLKQRLEREARAVSALNHPHICTLHDIGAQDGIDFLVLEYLEGETLADRLRRGPLSLAQALEIAIEISSALDAAHRHGIIHRDLKPANVMLTKNGSKLMDFGLAKPLALTNDAHPAAGRITPSTPTLSLASLAVPASPLTEEGRIVGTFQYLAPEVLQGAESDTRSDLFSFGCLLYEMITGRPAFEGKSQVSVLAAILEKEPEHICRIRSNSPPRLDETVRRTLAKNPEERYGCAHDVRVELSALLASIEQGTTVEPGAGSVESIRRWAGWTAAACLALVAIIASGAYVNLRTRPMPVVRSAIPPPPGTAFVITEPQSGPPVLSPDGTRLAFTARDEKGKVLLYLRLLSSLEAQPLAGTEEASYPFWSPDSREIGFFAQGKLKRTGVTGGPPEILCDALRGRGGAWNSSGTIVFTPGPGDPLFQVSAHGGAVLPVSKLDTAQGENSHRWPYFLPDDKHFLFWARGTSGPQQNSVYVGELGSLKARLLINNSESMATYVPGYLLFVRNHNLIAQPFDVRRLALRGEPVPIAAGVAFNVTTNRPIFSASDTGTLVYREGAALDLSRLAWFGRDGKQLGAASERDNYFSLKLSRDGKHVAVSLYGNQGGGDIWIFDFARGTKTRLTFSAPLSQLAVSPVWSPDGSTLFYSSLLSSGQHIFARAVDGGGPEQLILKSPDASIENPTDVSLDGRYLIYLRRSPSVPHLDIWALPLVGERTPFPLVESAFDKHEAMLSPDGKWISYFSNDSGRYEIYITAFAGTGAKWQVSVGGGVFPRWRADGKELFFFDLEDKIMAVDVDTSRQRVELGVPHALFTVPAVHRTEGFDISGDGKKFLLTIGEPNEGSQPLTLVQNWTAELKK